jgi:3-carboxy-cis,cis-muconate cycloisomerase
MSQSSSVFELLSTLAGDDGMAAIFSEHAMIESWLRTEAALASAQAELGIVPAESRDAIATAALADNIDTGRLWAEARIVGYPILPLVRQVDKLLPEQHRGWLHLGATTQDIMDTGLALQLAAATTCLREQLRTLCDDIASAAMTHQRTVMPGRTHAMLAVPTTWGIKLAVYLAELSHLYRRLGTVGHQAGTVSFYGAGGTSAAYGPRAAEIRRLAAGILGLRAQDVPWHVARGRVAEWGQACVSLVAAIARLAREVIDLSRTEIGEVAEPDGYHRGASSTMPQKRNPITSETLVGNAVVAGALGAALARIMEAGHERAAGEWHAEWFVLPHLAALAGSSLTGAAGLVVGLNVDQEAMRRNLTLDHGLIMAEAYMIGLAPVLGRERAHDVVYEAARRAREERKPLQKALEDCVPEEGRARLGELDPEDYVGDPELVVAGACRAWEAARESSADEY